jgi:hypothetical protein
MQDTIAKTFGLVDTNEYQEALVTSKPIVRKPKPKEINTESDYELVRSNLKELIDTGTDAIYELLTLAKATEHPRAYEVLATLMKTIGDQNKDLMDIELKVKGSSKEESTQTATNINNAIFVGSTKDLRQLLNE